MNPQQRPPAPPVLAVTELTVQRGATTILQDLAWRVERGEHWVILGGNGSGKTSLLSAITGYLTPSRGEITVLRRCYGRADWRELRRAIGLVSSVVRQMIPDSEPALSTVISGRYAMIELWGTPRRADMVRGRRLLAEVECEDLDDRPWGCLSQGERQRVLIGRALMGRPRLLILDEPCAGLDPVAREHFLQFIDRLGRRPQAPTLVLVTHHVEEIMPVFTHVLCLRQGRVLAAGERSAVLSTAVLRRTFGWPLRLRARAGRYELSVAAARRGVI